MKPMVFAAVLLVAFIGQYVAETLTENAEVDSPMQSVVKRSGYGGVYIPYYGKATKYVDYGKIVPKYGGYRKKVPTYKNYPHHYFYKGKWWYRPYSPLRYGYSNHNYRYGYATNGY